VYSDRKSPAPALLASPGPIAAIGLVLLALASPAPTDGAQRVVPSIGSYKTSGRGDPPRYDVRAQVKRKAGRRAISAQVTDACGGFATFARVAISGISNGEPEFSARVGAAAISGRWTTSTRIEGSVKTPCAKRQDYVMVLRG
jgi:hypothetical protein